MHIARRRHFVSLQVLYLYFRRVMSWTMAEYTRYTTVSGLAGTLSQGLLVPFLSTKLKWQVRGQMIPLIPLIQGMALQA